MKKIYKCIGDCPVCNQTVYIACWYKHKHKLKKGDKINIQMKNKKMVGGIWK